ncbi:MAG: hypothetical protein LBC87_04390 [Fibromonadaceae bacterium]|nr:hypothetical protein [Fibromonadaceae bacterium]
MHISITAFLFCLGFALALGYVFAWIYNYGKLHKEPEGEPQKVTDTLSAPVPIIPTEEHNNSALKRLEQEKALSETDFANRDAFIKKLLMLFRSRLEKENDKILSICYWIFNGEGFALKLSNSAYRFRENLFVPKDSKYFSRREFNWNGLDEAPIDVFHSEEQITRSIAGAAVSGEGKFHGYITIDSSHENAFDEEICMELRELANVAEEMLRNLDMNYKLNRENNLFYGMLKDISNLFSSVSKGNLIANLSKILRDNFKSNRMMIIVPAEREKDKWLISEAAGDQSEKFKKVVFSVHSKCLLHELLSGKVQKVNEVNIPTDPYQRRFYENEPENLELRSLFAVMPPVQNNAFPIAVVLESMNNRAVSRMDETLLTNIIACAALKLSDIQSRDASQQKRNESFAGIDSNGLGELLSFYHAEFNDLRDSEDSLGILFLKCVNVKREYKVNDFDRFLSVLRELKKAWNGKHLAMLGNGEFVFSVRSNLKEDIFEMAAAQIITNAENMLAEHSLSVRSHSIWLNKNRMEEIEQKYKQSYGALFAYSVMNKFLEMDGAN